MTEIARAGRAGPLYFGWRVVIALFLCLFALFGVSIYSFIIFTTPMAREFGWSPGQAGALVSAMWLIAPLALVFGPATAKIPAWRLVIAGLCIQAIALLALGHITSFGQLYLLRIFMGLGKVMTASTAPLIVARWFSRRFATAVAVVWAGGAAGGFVLSPLTASLCDALGWRGAAQVVAFGVLAVAGLAALMARGPASPAVMGLELDGAPRTGLTAPVHHAPAARTGGSGVARIAPAIGLMMFVSVVGAGMTSIAGQAQQPAFLGAAGFSAQVAATILGLTAAGALVGSASIGWVLDHYRGRVGAVIVSSAVYLGLLALVLVERHAGVLVAAVGAFGLGYGFGAGEVLWIAFTRRQFGEAAFPVAYGGWYFALQLGYALGGGVGGWALERFGTQGLLMLLAALYLPPTLGSLLVPAAHRRVDGELKTDLN